MKSCTGPCNQGRIECQQPVECDAQDDDTLNLVLALAQWALLAITFAALAAIMAGLIG